MTTNWLQIQQNLEVIYEELNKEEEEKSVGENCTTIIPNQINSSSIYSNNIEITSKRCKTIHKCKNYDKAGLIDFLPKKQQYNKSYMHSYGICKNKIWQRGKYNGWIGIMQQ